MGSGEWDTGTSEASHVPALTIVAVFSLMVYVGEWALSMALALFGWVFGRWEEEMEVDSRKQQLRSLD